MKSLAAQKKSLPVKKNPSQSIRAHIETIEVNGEKELEYRETQQESIRLLKNLNQLRTRDSYVKIGIRIILTLFFCTLLIIQNFLVYQIIIQALKMKELQDLQLIFSVLVTGTLAETYFVAKKIVEWMLTPIDYTWSSDKREFTTGDR